MCKLYLREEQKVIKFLKMYVGGGREKIANQRVGEEPSSCAWCFVLLYLQYPRAECGWWNTWQLSEEGVVFVGQ